MHTAVPSPNSEWFLLCARQRRGCLAAGEDPTKITVVDPTTTRQESCLRVLLIRRVRGTSDTMTISERTSTRLASRTYFFFVAWIFSPANFSAVSSASSAATLTSGATPVPSQLVLVTGSSDLANGTPTVK